MSFIINDDFIMIFMKTLEKCTKCSHAKWKTYLCRHCHLITTREENKDSYYEPINKPHNEVIRVECGCNLSEYCDKVVERSRFLFKDNKRQAVCGPCKAEKQKRNYPKYYKNRLEREKKREVLRRVLIKS